MIDVRADRMRKGSLRQALLRQAQGRIDQPFDGEVQGVRAVEREDEVLGFFPVKQRVQTPPAVGQDGAGFDRLGVRAAAGAGAEFGCVTVHCRQHRSGLREAGGRVVHV